MTHEPDACRPSCSLSSAQLHDRMASINAMLRAHPHHQTELAHGRQLTFDHTPELDTRLTHLIRLETECCPFLELTLRRDDTHLVLTITGGPNAQAQIADLFG